VNVSVFQSTKPRRVAGILAVLVQVVIGTALVVSFMSNYSYIGAVVSAFIAAWLVYLTNVSERFGAEVASASLFMAVILGVLWVLPSKEVQYGSWLANKLARDLTTAEQIMLLGAVVLPNFLAIYALGKITVRKF
jgi:hypothetical protein